MEPSVDDGLKWFGEGFDGFPKRLPEDTVEYAIYSIDTNLDKAKTASKLRLLLKEINLQTKELLEGYIWQREAFDLSLELVDDIWCLKGQTNYGDSVADEWLIVYILREISRKIPDIWVRVFDTDGEFLLIEAANVIPRWLKPEISENRVWIHAGKLKIIPRQASTPLAFRAPSLPEAILYIETQQQNLMWSPMVEEEAFYRIRKYPQAIKEQFHHSLVRIPRNLAYILHEHPEYISPAVEAFYLRDPVAIKPLQNSDPMSLLFSPKDCVISSVKFTIVGFAQLRSQEFEEPDSWQDSIKEITPQKNKDRAEVGMKLACGFEMLVRDTKNKDKKAVREIQIILEDLEAGDEVLPTDNEIGKWPQQDDDESWMDIDFNDFEKELAGKSARGGQTGAGFGDQDAQEQLQKMVSRFEAFMNDDKAGLDGADFDDDDDEDSLDSEDDSSSDDDEEDREISFDEDEFTRMMRQMMGMPADDNDRTTTTVSKLKSKDRVSEVAESDEDEEINKVADQIKSELDEAGVLQLESATSTTSTKQIQQKGKQKVISQDEIDGEDEDEEINIDFNLAKNMLDAFNSQGGAPGPAGNLMGLMGVTLPPNKDK